VSFGTTVRQMTAIFRVTKLSQQKMTEMSQRKKAALKRDPSPSYGRNWLKSTTVALVVLRMTD